MDIITKSFLDEFVEDFNLKTLSESEQFELFGNYCVVNKEYNSNNFELRKTLTGQATQGIDGMAFIVNNRIVNSVIEIQDLIEINRYLDVQFVIIQSKTSPKFDNMQIENFFRWSKNFFYGDNSLFATEEMLNFIDMKNYIYKNARYFKKKNPVLSMYFISTGKWEDDSNLNNIINLNKREIEEGNLFSDILFEACDAKLIQGYYRKTQEQISATITFKDKVTLPPIPNVKEAYSGFLPFNEYKKIIIDDSGKMKPVFDDNIRDYLEQKDNQVNKDISSTITEKKFEYFSILNNGVTVVAEERFGAGNEMTIVDYQIVNGCQTSHVLFDNKNIDGSEAINVPLKIIITNDSNIKNQITRATNNQTAVGVEELESLSEFQRKLEMFYKSYGKDKGGLYYERRTNQYSKLNIPKYKIINIEMQVKVFSAMFLDQPHMVSGYYGKVVKQMGDRIFKNDHEPIAYYTSSLVFNKIAAFLDNGNIPKGLAKMRWHILMMVKYLIRNGNPPYLNSKKIINYCEEIVSVFEDEKKAIEVINDAIKILYDPEVGLNFSDRKTSERKSTTESLLNIIKRR